MYIPHGVLRLQLFVCGMLLCSGGLVAQVSMSSTSASNGKTYVNVLSPALVQNIDTLFVRVNGGHSSSAAGPHFQFQPLTSAPSATEGAVYYDGTADRLVVQTSSGWVNLATSSDLGAPSSFNIAGAAGALAGPYSSGNLLNLDPGLVLSVSPKATLDAATDLLTITESGYYRIDASSGFQTSHGGHDIFTLAVVRNGVDIDGSLVSHPHNHVPGYAQTSFITYLTAGDTIGLVIYVTASGGNQLASTLQVSRVG